MHDQDLQILQHKVGHHQHSEGVFAECLHCNKKWTCKQLVNDYSHQGLGIDEAVDDVPIANDKSKEEKQTLKDGMLADIVKHQKDGAGSM